MRKRMKKLVQLNNRGSSLAVVLILVTFMAVLSVTATTMSMTNLKIKKLSNTTTKSFYSAEDAIDQIYTALGKLSMESLDESYSEQLSVLPAYATPNDNYEYNGRMRRTYAAKILSKCKVSGIAVTESDGFGTKYSMDYTNASTNPDDTGYNEEYKNIIDVLNSFILLDADSAVAADKADSERLLKVDSIKGIKVVNINNTHNEHELSNYQLQIEQCVVSYRSNASGFYSSISFDTSLSMPDIFINFVELTKGIDAFKTYSLIGNTGIGIAAESGNSVTINSSIYAGKNKGLLIGAGATLSANMNGSNRTAFITEGDIKIGEDSGAGNLKISGAGITEDGSNGVELWSNGLLVAGNQSDVDVTAKSYIKDDLQVDANRSTVKLQGVYNGYGWQSDQYTGNHYNSSAIIVNGMNNTVDISGLSKLLVAGRVYIDFSHYMFSDGFKEVIDQSSITDPYKTGESISSSGMQEIYLVPSMLITGKANPVVKTSGVVVDTEMLKKSLQMGSVTTADGKTAVNTDTAFFGAAFLDQNEPYSTETVDGKIYYYLNFANDQSMQAYISAIYNEDAYNATAAGTENTILNNLKKQLSVNGASLENTVVNSVTASYDRSREYVKGLVELNSNELKNSIVANNGNDNVVIDGKFIRTGSTDGSEEITVDGGSVNGSNESYLKDRFTDYATKFTMLSKTLQDDSSVYAETYIGSDMYDSIIDSDGFNIATKDSGTGFDYSGSLSGDSYNLKVYNNGNAGSPALVIGSGAGEYNCSKGIVVAAGDVIVKQDFNGTIIAGGSITLMNSAKITNTKVTTTGTSALLTEEILNECKAVIAVGSGVDDAVKNKITTFMNVFRAYNAKDISGNGGSSLNGLEFSDFITLTNWSKTEIGN